jgi:hypothetical protein
MLRTAGLACLLSLGCLAPLSRADEDLPPDAAYVVAEDGRLVLDGQPVRYWGSIGHFPGKPTEVDGDIYNTERRIVQRLLDHGHNLIRHWRFGNFNRKTDYVKGDGSRRDRNDFFLAECKRRGIAVWPAGLGGGFLLGDEVEEAADMIDEPATRDAWIEATRSMMKDNDWRARGTLMMRPQYAMVAVFDPRHERWSIEQMRERVDHVNQHTGLRYADEPNNVVWELTNEQWWLQKMFRGQWRKLPDFFQQMLFERWHTYLAEKYETDEKLAAAWGFLLPGESIAGGSVLLTPSADPVPLQSFNDVNPEALANFENVESDKGFGPDTFTKQRSADVIEFFTLMLIDHKTRFAEEFKTWGKSCRLSPVMLDTGIGESIQAQYMQQHGDAITHCAYMEGTYPDHADPNDPAYPFYTGLTRFPQLGNDVPWLEHNRHPDKPYLCYETQFGNPGKYRAEFPLRLVALGSVQDWSNATFHTWSIGKWDFTKDYPADVEQASLSFPGPAAYQYDYTFDEVGFAVRRVAGEIFKNHHLKPVEDPTIFTYGAEYLYDPASMKYGRSYGPEGLDNMMYTAHAEGMQLIIDPEAETSVEGDVVRMKRMDTPTVIRPTEQIEYDTTRGHLMFDAPGVASYVGFLARYGSDLLEFDNGVKLSNVTFNNPENAPFPVTEDEKYLAFTLVSTTPESLEETDAAVMTLVSTSFNTGLELDPVNGVKKWGKGPILTTRVGGTVEAEAIDGMTYVFRDFGMQEIASGTVADGRLVVPDDQPIFLVELTR